VHEVETFVICIEELIRASFHIDKVNLGSCGESILEDTTVFEVTKLCLHESRAFARLHMLEINYLARLTVETKI